MADPSTLERWLAVVATRDLDAIPGLLADDVNFHSPIVHAPIRGRDEVARALRAAFRVFTRGDFRYTRTLAGPGGAALEFRVNLGTGQLHGVDLIAWNHHGQIADFTVFLRPLQAIKLMHQQLAETSPP